MESEEADDLGIEAPGNCEWCGEETINALEECPSCGKFLCKTCEGIHSCDDVDVTQKEEDADEQY